MTVLVVFVTVVVIAVTVCFVRVGIIVVQRSVVRQGVVVVFLIVRLVELARIVTPKA